MRLDESAPVLQHLEHWPCMWPVIQPEDPFNNPFKVCRDMDVAAAAPECASLIVRIMAQVHLESFLEVGYGASQDHRAPGAAAFHDAQVVVMGKSLHLCYILIRSAKLLLVFFAGELQAYRQGILYGSLSPDTDGDFCNLVCVCGTLLVALRQMLFTAGQWHIMWISFFHKGKFWNGLLTASAATLFNPIYAF
jgi:hypothetical protein